LVAALHISASDVHQEHGFMSEQNMETSSQPLTFGGAAATRGLWQSMVRGFRQRCPSCGESRMFRAFLKVHEHCPSCGEALHHHRADDAPPYFTIFIVAHIVVPIAAYVERSYAPDMVWQAVAWSTMSILLSLWFLPRVKGSLIGLQWANQMHGFGGETEGTADDALPEYIDR
jgi:uncharacterized protein (DUF983 family)